MLNRFSKGSILLKKNVTRKGFRIETNYEFPLSLDDGEITITLSNMTLSECAACYHLGEKLFEFSPCLSRTFDKYVVIGCYSSDSEYCFVAKHGDRIVGFLLGSIIEKRTNYGYINWVAVEPFYQRKGVGTVLVDFVEKKMQEEDKVEMILVDTPKTNIKAIKFLEQLGFSNPTEQVYLTYTLATPPSTPLLSISTPSIPSISYDPISSNNDSILQKRKEPEDKNGTEIPPLKNLKSDSDGVNTDNSNNSISSNSNPSNASISANGTPKLSGLADEIIIRPLNLDDIWPVFQVGEMAFTSQRPNLYRFWDESQVIDAYETDSDLSLVAEYKGEIVGFALGSTLERADTKFGYLIWLGVSTALQGKNIGRKLYFEYEKLIRNEGISTIIVDTQSTNVDAIRFFERIGFRLQEEFYYYSKPVKQNELDGETAK